jgi:hypothetical protein
VPPAADPAPVIATQTVTETRTIPFRTQFVRDSSLPRGEKRTETEGVEGEQTLSWLVTYTDGRQTGRQLVGTTVSRQPRPRVVAFGWRERGWDREPGWGNDRGPRHGHHRECGPSLDFCGPLDRSACPDEAPSDDGVQLGDSFTLLDEDLPPFDPESFDDQDPTPAPGCFTA